MWLFHAVPIAWSRPRPFCSSFYIYLSNATFCERCHSNLLGQTWYLGWRGDILKICHRYAGCWMMLTRQFNDDRTHLTDLRSNKYSVQLSSGIFTANIIILFLSKDINEPHHEKTGFCHMQTTKAQTSLRIRTVWSAPLLFAA